VANDGVKAEQLEKALKKEIENLKNGKITKQEIEKVKINAKSDFIYSLQSSASINSLYGSYLIRGNIEPLEKYEANLDKITPQIISSVAKKYFDDRYSTTIILRRNDK